jgi:hypothetical protein
MQPRIYTYKITFEEVPYWYWGVHKERKYNDGYMGSPKTHKWMWEFYTPKIQILEFFPYTAEGWKKAQEIEKRLIRPDLNKVECLNESCGGSISLVKSSENGKEQGRLNALLKRGFCGRSPEQMRADGRRNGLIHGPLNMVLKRGIGRLTSEELSSNGRLGAMTVHEAKDEDGKSIHAKTVGKKSHEKKSENGKSAHATRVGNITYSLGKGCHAPEHKGKGAKVTNSQKWIDPDHPELGERSAPTLAYMQKRRGYPHGKENRVQVG